MPKIDKNEWETIQTELQISRLEGLSKLDRFSNEIAHFQSVNELSGEGWSSAKNYLSPYQEITKAIFNYLSDSGQAIQNYLSSFSSEVGSPETQLDTAILSELQQKITRLQLEKQEFMLELAGFLPVDIVRNYAGMLKDYQIDNAQKKVDILEKYQEFEMAHASDLSEALSIGSDIEIALTNLGKASRFNPTTGKYSQEINTQSDWYKNIVKYNKDSPTERTEVKVTEIHGEKIYEVFVNGILNNQATWNYNWLLAQDSLEMLGHMTGEMTYYPVQRLITGKDPVTGDKTSRLTAAGWTALLLLSEARFIQVVKEIRAGNKLLKGVQLTEKELVILNKAGYLNEAQKIEKIVENVNGFEEILDINIKEFEIKNKHLNSSTAKRARKFNVSSAEEANKIVQEALKNGKLVETIPNGVGSQGQNSFSSIIDTGKVIGTKGETHIKIVYDELKNVWTTYPVPKP